MKTIVSCLFVVIIAGCVTKGTLPHYLSYLPEEQFGPLVSWSQLYEQDGKVYEKHGSRPFTGQTIRYWAGAYLLYAYKDGSVPDGLPDRPPVEGEFNPTHAACQDAIRAYVKEYGPQHDTYFFFQKCGNKDDLPILLYGLKSEDVAPSANYGIVCTQLHCVDALKKITGANPGLHYSDWATWWREEYRTEPPEWKPERK